MKKTLFIIVAMCLTFAACNGNKTTKEETVNYPFSVVTVSVSDSILCYEERIQEAMQFAEWVDDSMAYYHYEMDLPVTDNQALKNSIEGYLFMETEFPEDLEKTPENVKAYLELDENDYSGYYPSEYYITDAKLLEDADRYVTYSKVEEMAACGSMEPSYTYAGVTFKKDTGRIFTWDMFSDEAKALEIVKNAILEQHFEVNMEEFSEDDLYEYFDECGPDGLALPNTQPWIQDGKLIALYQQGEVSNRFVALPTCELPYEAIKDILTEEGRAYFE